MNALNKQYILMRIFDRNRMTTKALVRFKEFKPASVGTPTLITVYIIMQNPNKYFLQLYFRDSVLEHFGLKTHPF